jgi:hypothetical protein
MTESSKSYAAEIIKDVIRPSYKQQLQEGLNTQKKYSKYSHYFDIFSHFISAIATFLVSYSYYNPSNLLQLLTIIAVISIQFSKIISSVYNSEEIKTAQSNAIITTQVLNAINIDDTDEVSTNNSNNNIENPETSVHLITTVATKDNDSKDNEI